MTAGGFSELQSAVALRIERRTNGREVIGSTPARTLLRNILRKVVHIVVPLSTKQYKLVPV